MASCEVFYQDLMILQWNIKQPKGYRVSAPGVLLLVFNFKILTKEQVAIQRSEVT